MRIFFLEGNITPYLLGNFGYTFGQARFNSHKSTPFTGQGVLFAFGFGIQMQTSSEIGLNFDIGYRSQNFLKGSIDVIGLNVGVSFF